MLVHRAHDGLRRCREKKGMCPYGGPVGQTLSRNRGGNQENSREGSENALPYNAKGLPLVSSGAGKFIRPGESKSRELSTKFADRFNEQNVQPIAHSGATTEERGARVMEIMRRNNQNVSSIFEGLAKDPKTNRYVANGYLEFNGKEIGTRSYERATVWNDEVVVQNNFKCRVHKSGRLYATLNLEGVDYSFPVGDVSDADLSNGRFIARLDKIFTKMNARKKDMSQQEQVAFFKKEYAGTSGGSRRPSGGMPFSYTQEEKSTRVDPPLVYPSDEDEADNQDEDYDDSDDVMYHLLNGDD